MSKKYETTVLEICENGDAIIELPPELIHDYGWELEDILDIKFEDGCVVVVNLSKQKREEVIK